MDDLARMVAFYETLAHENHERMTIRAQIARKEWLEKKLNKRRPKAERDKRRAKKQSKRRNR